MQMNLESEKAKYLDIHNRMHRAKVEVFRSQQAFERKFVTRAVQTRPVTVQVHSVSSFAESDLKTWSLTEAFLDESANKVEIRVERQRKSLAHTGTQAGVRRQKEAESGEQAAASSAPETAMVVTLPAGGTRIADGAESGEAEGGDRRAGAPKRTSLFACVRQSKFSDSFFNELRKKVQQDKKKYGELHAHAHAVSASDGVANHDTHDDGVDSDASEGQGSRGPSLVGARATRGAHAQNSESDGRGGTASSNANTGDSDTADSSTENVIAKNPTQSSSPSPPSLARSPRGAGAHASPSKERGKAFSLSQRLKAKFAKSPAGKGKGKGKGTSVSLLSRVSAGGAGGTTFEMISLRSRLKQRTEELAGAKKVRARSNANVYVELYKQTYVGMCVYACLFDISI